MFLFLYLCVVIKQVLHNVFSIALAILVLLSTVSFTIEKHYCGDVLVDVSVFTEVEKCGMEPSEIESSKLIKKSCCKDEIEFMHGQDELKFTSFDDLDIDQQLIFASFIYSYINLYDGLPKQIIPHRNYSPPNLVADIQVLDQVFVI